jgi:hypothetical protein
MRENNSLNGDHYKIEGWSRHAVLMQVNPTKERGRVGIPILLWIAGVPFTLVFFIWLFFFRGP